MAVSNPRFPFSFRVLRAQADEHGNAAFDENGNALTQALLLTITKYERNLPKMRKVVVPVYETDEYGEYVLMENGERIETGTEEVERPDTYQAYRCPFGYRQQTANAVVNGDAIIAEMKIGCPMILGEIITGDLLELTDDDRTFHAQVVKKINTNFGTNIWYNEVKQ